MTSEGGPPVLVVAPFRRPTFRKAISPLYPVQEPWDSPPLIISGALRAVGFRVSYLPLQQIFDGWDDERDGAALRELLGEHHPVAVVFASDSNVASRSTASVYGIRLVAGLLASLGPLPVMAVTGRVATTAGLRLLDQVPELDFAVIGEAEGVIADLLVRRICNGIDSIADHPSVLVRDQNGTPRQAAMLPDADSAPMPAWDLLPPAIKLFNKQHPGWSHAVPVSIRTSIGCVFECKFCAGIPNWRTYRTKSASRVAAEIDGLVHATGALTRLSFLEDEIFTRDLGHAQAVAAVFADRGIRVDGVYTHARLMTDAAAEAVTTMTRRVFLGMDSADDRTLLEMGKGQRVGQVLEAVTIARRAGLLTHLEWIVGSPSETVDSLITSLVAIFGLLSTGTVDSINTYVYCPHPGTAYEREAARYGMRVVEDFDGIQESGGFPGAALPSMTRNQVYAAYLMTQLVIAELRLARKQASTVVPPSRTELRQIFDQIALAD